MRQNGFDSQLLEYLVEQKLAPGDKLPSLNAWRKLRGEPPYIPNTEHRQLHLTIFSRLDNPFVQGLLAAYWEAYEASERTRYAGLEYWFTVWTYHEQIIEAIQTGALEHGRQLLKEHFDLLPE